MLTSADQDSHRRFGSGLGILIREECISEFGDLFGSVVNLLRDCAILRSWESVKCPLIRKKLCARCKFSKDIGLN